MGTIYNSKVIERIWSQPHLFHTEIILTAMNLAFIEQGTDQDIALPLTKGDLEEGVGVLQIPGIQFTHNLGGTSLAISDANIPVQFYPTW